MRWNGGKLPSRHKGHEDDNSRSHGSTQCWWNWCFPSHGKIRTSSPSSNSTYLMMHPLDNGMSEYRSVLTIQIGQTSWPIALGWTSVAWTGVADGISPVAPCEDEASALAADAAAVVTSICCPACRDEEPSALREDPVSDVPSSGETATTSVVTGRSLLLRFLVDISTEGGASISPLSSGCVASAPAAVCPNLITGKVSKTARASPPAVDCPSWWTPWALTPPRLGPYRSGWRIARMA